MSALGLLDVGPMELLVVVCAAIMLFGGDLPDIARRTGHYIGRLRAAANDLAREFDAPADLLKLPEPDEAMHRPPPAAPRPEAGAGPQAEPDAGGSNAPPEPPRETPPGEV